MLSIGVAAVVQPSAMLIFAASKCACSPFQQRCGIFLSFDFLHHEEFIAAHAEDGSLVTDVAEDFGCGADELVAGFVAERVIRLLEPVEVAEDKGDAPSAGRDASDSLKPRRFSSL